MLGLLCDFWKSLFLEGRIILQNYYQSQSDHCPLRGPWMDTFSSWLWDDREHPAPWRHSCCSGASAWMSLMPQVTLDGLWGFSVVSDFSVVSQVGKLTTWEPSTARVHVHIQESLVSEILTVSAAGQGWCQAELLILKMCCLEARERSEVCVTFSPLEI